jgi:phosphatidylglycerophosphate synthase
VLLVLLLLLVIVESSAAAAVFFLLAVGPSASCSTLRAILQSAGAPGSVLLQFNRCAAVSSKFSKRALEMLLLLAFRVLGAGECYWLNWRYID